MALFYYPFYSKMELIQQIIGLQEIKSNLKTYKKEEKYANRISTRIKQNIKSST